MCMICVMKKLQDMQRFQKISEAMAGYDAAVFSGSYLATKDAGQREMILANYKIHLGLTYDVLKIQGYTDKLTENGVPVTKEKFIEDLSQSLVESVKVYEEKGGEQGFESADDYLRQVLERLGRKAPDADDSGLSFDFMDLGGLGFGIGIGRKRPGQ